MFVQKWLKSAVFLGLWVEIGIFQVKFCLISWIIFNRSQKCLHRPQNVIVGAWSFFLLSYVMVLKRRNSLEVQ
jgi:hypothetical protein